MEPPILMANEQSMIYHIFYIKRVVVLALVVL